MQGGGIPACSATFPDSLTPEQNTAAAAQVTQPFYCKGSGNACPTSASSGGTTVTWSKVGTTGSCTLAVVTVGTTPVVAVSNAAPTLALTSPASGDTIVRGNAFTIAFSAADSDDAAKISLYFKTSSAGCGAGLSGWTMLTNSLAEGSQTSFSWNTAGRIAGNYYICGVIDDGKNTPQYALSSSFLQIANGPVLGTAFQFATGDGPEGVAVGDVNGDAKPDIITGDYTGKSVSILLGNGDGTFAAKQTFSTVTTNLQAVMISLADVNEDGSTDIVFGGWGPNYVGVFVNATAANSMTMAFANSNQPVLYAGDSGPKMVAITDLNGDGHLDFAVAVHNGNWPNIFLNQSGAIGTFGTKGGTGFLINPGTQNPPAGTGHSHMIGVADVNSDGKPDLMMPWGYQGWVSTMLNKSTVGGSADFQPTNLTDTTGSGCVGGETIDYADFNEDGKVDAVIACPAATPKMVILYNQTATGATSATWAVDPGIVTDANLRAVGARDLNGDGHKDLVAVASGTSNVANAVSVYLGHGDGTFAVAQSFAIGSVTNPKKMALMDVNGDGRPDVVVTNAATDMVTVLLNMSL